MSEDTDPQPLPPAVDLVSQLVADATAMRALWDASAAAIAAQTVGQSKLDAARAKMASALAAEQANVDAAAAELSALAIASAVAHTAIKTGADQVAADAALIAAAP